MARAASAERSSIYAQGLVAETLLERVSQDCEDMALALGPLIQEQGHGVLGTPRPARAAGHRRSRPHRRSCGAGPGMDGWGQRRCAKLRCVSRPFGLPCTGVSTCAPAPSRCQPNVRAQAEGAGRVVLVLQANQPVIVGALGGSEAVFPLVGPQCLGRDAPLTRHCLAAQNLRVRQRRRRRARPGASHVASPPRGPGRHAQMVIRRHFEGVASVTCKERRGACVIAWGTIREQRPCAASEPTTHYQWCASFRPYRGAIFPPTP